MAFVRRGLSDNAGDQVHGTVMKAAAVWMENNNRNPGPNLLTPGIMPGCRVSNSGSEQALMLKLQEICAADAIHVPLCDQPEDQSCLPRK